ncbi:MAG TPA: DUF58 domain-containing protein [Chromatiales bacterium]|nr:DUF58 domain-containing protein [Chromatiales bacterium]
MPVSLRPEPLAWPFLGILVVLIIGSVQYASNLGFFFSFWLASIAGLGLLVTRRRLLRVEARTVHTEAGFEDEDLHLTLELRGDAGLPVEASLRDGPRASAAMPGPEWSEVTLDLPSRGRGAHILPPLHLVMRDPLGLVRLERIQPLGRRYWVYPAPRGERPLPPPAGDTRPRGQDDFAGLRTYQAGDSPARIHWRSLARGGDLHTKQFGGEDLPHGPRILDEERLANLPREARLRQLSAWIMACEANGESYGLHLRHGAALPRGLGSEHRTRALHLLAEAPRT